MSVVIIDITGISDKVIHDGNAKFKLRDELISLFADEGFGEDSVLIHFFRKDKSNTGSTPIVARVNSADFTTMKADRRERTAERVLEILELAGHSSAYVLLDSALTTVGRKAAQFA